MPGPQVNEYRINEYSRGTSAVRGVHNKDGAWVVMRALGRAVHTELSTCDYNRAHVAIKVPPRDLVTC